MRTADVENSVQLWLVTLNVAQAHSCVAAQAAQQASLPARRHDNRDAGSAAHTAFSNRRNEQLATLLGPAG